MITCPHCQSKIVKRKRRKGIDKYIPYKKNFSCGNCKKTFSRFIISKKVQIVIRGVQ